MTKSRRRDTGRGAEEMIALGLQKGYTAQLTFSKGKSRLEPKQVGGSCPNLRGTLPGTTAGRRQEAESC